MAGLLYGSKTDPARRVERRLGMERLSEGTARGTPGSRDDRTVFAVKPSRRFTMQTCPRHFLVALVVLVTPACIWAQGESSFGKIRSGQLVRIRTSDGQLLEGRFTAVPSQPMSLRLEDRALALSTLGVDSVWARGNHAKRGAILGAVVVGIPAAAAGYALCELASDGAGCQDWEIVPLLMLAGAATGGGIGALIGSAAPRWSLRYARPGIALRLQPTRRRLGFSVTVPWSALH